MAYQLDPSQWQMSGRPSGGGSIAGLDQQIADLRNRSMNSGAGDTRDEMQRLLNQRNQLAASGKPLSDPIQGARDKIRELTEGRAGQLGKDPVMGSSQNFMQSVLSGKQTPFNSGVQNAMLAQNARGAAAAEQAQMQALRDSMAASGGSVYDPSFRAKQAELMAGRQGANLDAQGQLASQANLANFDAKANAANSLGSQRLGQNAQINQMDLAGAGYRAQESMPINQRPLQPPATTQGFFAPLIMGAGNYQQQQQAAPTQQGGYQQDGTYRPMGNRGEGNPIALQPGYVQAGYKPKQNTTQPDPYAGYI